MKVLRRLRNKGRHSTKKVERRHSTKSTKKEKQYINSIKRVFGSQHKQAENGKNSAKPHSNKDLMRKSKLKSKAAAEVKQEKVTNSKSAEVFQKKMKGLYKGTKKVLGSIQEKRMKVLQRLRNKGRHST